MTGLRINPLLAISLAVLAIVLVAGALIMTQGRESQMRDAEADFLAKVRSGAVKASPAPVRPAQRSSGNTAQAHTAPEQDDLAAWYAEAGNRADSATKTGAPPASPAQP